MQPSKGELAGFIMKVFEDTGSEQVLLSPEFTTCKMCGATFRNLREKCEFCGSEESGKNSEDYPVFKPGIRLE